MLLVILCWEVAARALEGAYLLAGPSDVLVYLGANAGLMWRALMVTLGEAAAGFVIGNLAAIALAAVAMIFPRAERAISWLALLVFCLPIVATGPILRVLFGPGPGPQVTLAALAVFYTTLIPLLVGVRAAPATWFDLVRSYGRGRVAMLVHVRAMAALPYLFAGLQIAAPAAVLGAMVGEFTGAERGMGVLAIRAMRTLDIEATWALATLATVVSILVYAVVGQVARLLLKDPPPLILAPPRPSEGGSGGGWRTTLASVVVVGALAVLLWWAGLEAAGVPPFFGKRPSDVLAFLVTVPDAAAHRATLAAALAETALYVVPGYLAGLALGAGLAAVLVLWPAFAAVAMPLAIALRSVPIITTAPLVVLLLGRGAAGTITLVAIMVFFPTLVACLHGMRQAPGQVLDVLDSYAAGPLDRLVHVQLPAMLPAFFAAARMAVPAAVLAVTVVEWLASGAGVGSLMALSASVSDYGMLWSALVILALLSCAGYAAVAAVERRVLAVFASEQLA
ncbi:MAG: ABC transporter permease [Rhodovulum sp.]